MTIRRRILRKSLTVGTIPLQPIMEASNLSRRETKRPPKPFPIMPIIIVLFIIAMIVGIVIRGKGPKGSCTYDHVYRRATCNTKQLKTIPADISETVLSLHIGHRLDKSENHFSMLSIENFTKYTHMQELALIKCGIEEIKPNTFLVVSQLKRLDLRFNRIQHIAPGTFAGLTALDYLHLSNNPIQSLGDSLFTGMVIEELFLENNPALVTISQDVFQGAKIQSLVLNRTSLTSLPQGVFTPITASLKRLTITNNMQPLVFSDDLFKGLKLDLLDLSNNGLLDAEFIENVEAEEIDLDDNPLEEIDFDDSKNLASIKNLSLQRTKLSKLQGDDLEGLINLEELDLEGNDITILNASVFQKLDKLRILDISKNDLFMFDGDFQQEFPMLETLNLEENDIQTVPEMLSPMFSRLKSLTIHNNPLHCNCEIRWFVKWIEAHREVLNELNSVECKTPESINLTLISDYGFQCREPKIFNATFDEDGISLVCTAGGDPAPKVTWISPHQEEKVALPLRSERKIFQTQNSFTVTKDGNYTCIAENVAGTISIVVDTKKMPSSGIKYHVESKEIEILETPQGFLITAALIFLLGYIIRLDSEKMLKEAPTDFSNS